MNIAALPKCRECKTAMLPGMKQCRNPKCRAWNIPRPYAVHDSVVRMSEKKGARVSRIITGLVDEVFGGGIAKTSVNLLAGDPGAGKTTLGLQLCSIICGQNPGRNAIYIANEQSSDELIDTGDRLQLENRENICIVNAMGGVTHDIGDLMKVYEPVFMILDSITKWAGEDMSLAVTIAQQIKDCCVALKAPCIIVNQVTKDGDQAGLKQLEHAVDMAAMFETLLDAVDENGEPIPPKLAPRRLMSSKNRFGPAPEEQFYRMTETGLVLTEAC
jgi:DNA repair protein RadA/Sms